jgi:hypothetical protein
MAADRTRQFEFRAPRPIRPAAASVAVGAVAGLIGLACLVAALSGCGGYSPSATDPVATSSPDQPQGKPPLMIGGYRAGSIHPTNVQTVYVQVFKSQEYRREIEFRLTEAIAKRILQDTPYKISARDKADTILYGELTSVPVTLLGKAFDSQLPKEVQTVLVCNWTWKDRRSGDILAQRRGMEQASDYIPLAGETFFDGTEIGINRLAQRIVEAMQAEW